MSFLNEAGLGVHNHYGPRTSRAPKGGIKTEGSIMECSMDVWGKELVDGDELYNHVLLPKGALITEAFCRVSEVFVLGGTDPVIQIGTLGSEGTNGFAITETQAEAVGTFKVDSFDGTWGSALAADTEVSIKLGGTSPTVTEAGKVRVTIRYVKLGIDPDAAAGAKGQGSI